MKRRTLAAKFCRKALSRKAARKRLSRLVEAFSVLGGRRPGEGRRYDDRRVGEHNVLEKERVANFSALTSPVEEHKRRLFKIHCKSVC